MTYGGAAFHADHLVQEATLGLGKAGHIEREGRCPKKASATNLHPQATIIAYHPFKSGKLDKGLKYLS